MTRASVTTPVQKDNVVETRIMRRDRLNGYVSLSGSYFDRLEITFQFFKKLLLNLFNYDINK